MLANNLLSIKNDPVLVGPGLLTTKIQTVKKRTGLKSRHGAGVKKYSGVRLMVTFFQNNDLVAAKETLNNITNYAVKRKSWIKEDPAVIFQFHQSMRMLVRAGYLIQQKPKKWITSKHGETASPFLLGSLSEKEFQEPLLVFKKAFEEYRIREFDYFMAGMVYRHIPEKNIVGPYIHLTKMLDAAHLILERSTRKINTRN